MGQIWILYHLQSRGIDIWVCGNFFFKIVQFFYSVCGSSRERSTEGTEGYFD